MIINKLLSPLSYARLSLSMTVNVTKWDSLHASCNRLRFFDLLVFDTVSLGLIFNQKGAGDEEDITVL